LKNKVKKENDKNSVFIAKKEETIFQGPLPPPQVLEGYKNIYEDAPKIIFETFKKEQENRYKTIRFGQISALMIGIGGLVSTTLLGIYGNAWVAGSIGFLSLGSLVGAYFYGKNK